MKNTKGLLVGGKDNPPVDNKVRTDWNDFLSYLDKKGLKGKPDLDKGGLGYKVFDEYVKQNPNTSLSRDSLPVIRKEILNYRQWVLDQAKQGKVSLNNGVNENNFMRHVVLNETTKDPNLPGQNLTSTIFPDAYLKTVDLSKGTTTTTNLGFSKIK